MYKYQYQHGMSDGLYRPDAYDRSLGRNYFSYEDFADPLGTIAGPNAGPKPEYPPSISRGTSLSPRGTQSPYPPKSSYEPKLLTPVRKDEPFQAGNQGVRALNKIEFAKSSNPPAVSIVDRAIPSYASRPDTLSRGGGSPGGLERGLAGYYQRRNDPGFSAVGVSQTPFQNEPIRLEQAALQSGQQISPSLSANTDTSTIALPQVTGWANDPATRNLQQYVYLRQLEEDYNQQAAEQAQEEALWANFLGNLSGVIGRLF